jgi:hypothetical protein
MKLKSVLILIIGTHCLFAQIKDYELGKSLLDIRYNQQTGNFDLSDPESVNIKVSVWGFVQYPGKYTVPIYTTVVDLLSYAGGPTADSDLEDLRLYRVVKDSLNYLIKFNYNDIMWESELKTRHRRIPTLEAGDILIITGSPRLYFKDYFHIALSITSTLISLAILIINIVK